MANEVEIGGVSFPSPAADGGITETWTQIWSQNKGITSTGNTVGTVIAVKRTVTFKWNHLTPAFGGKLIEVIRDAVRNNGGFISCGYFSAETGAYVSFVGEMDAPTLSHLLTSVGLAYIGVTSVTIKEA